MFVQLFCTAFALFKHTQMLTLELGHSEFFQNP